MTIIHLSGRITESGELELALPAGLPPGEAHVTIEVGEPEAWPPDDLAALLRVEPRTGTEIVAAGLVGGWADQGIADSTAWVEEQRRRRSISGPTSG